MLALSVSNGSMCSHFGFSLGWVVGMPNAVSSASASRAVSVSTSPGFGALGSLLGVEVAFEVIEQRVELVAHQLDGLV